MRQNLLFVAICLGLLAAQPGVRAAASGTFTDRDGKTHHWSINPAHTLIWESKPYIPVGGMFCPQSMVQEPSEENWNKDIQALKTLKDKGIQDIYVNPVHGATRFTAELWQKVIDQLENDGFRYGIELTDGPVEPLTGWIIRPNLYRLAGIVGDQKVEYSDPDLLGGLWAIADSATGEIITMEALKVRDGKASIDVRAGDGARVLLLYPVKRIHPSDGLQNLWSGYGEYRDRLVTLMSKLKLGPGLRFWVDPFINEMGLRGETPYLIPSSASYQVELESWLRRKYKDFGTLSRSWRLGNDIRNYEQASRLIPLWYGPKGLNYLYDTSTGNTSKIVSGGSRIWDDLLAFRNDSIQHYLNDISATLKRNVADVPVVVKWTATHDYLINDTDGGFDGIGVEAYGPPSVIGPFAGAQCLALAEQARRPMWIVATETQTTSDAGKQEAGYRSQNEMAASLGALKDAGCKGFYTFGFNLAPPWTNFDLLNVPEQLDWLRSFRDQIALEQLLADWRPRTVWFARERPLGAEITQLERDLWWLPKKGSAQEIPVGDALRAYSISDAEGEAIFVWTTGSEGVFEFPLPEGLRPIVHFTGPAPREAEFGKKSIKLPLSKYPAILRGLPAEALTTTEALLPQVEYLTILVERASAMKIPVFLQEMALTNARTRIKSGSLALAEATLASAIAELEPLVAPFDWIEGELASETSFLDVAYSPEASGYYYLKVDTEREAPFGSYSASYPLFASTDAEYDIWLGGLSPGLTLASPVSWSLDDSSWVPAATGALDGSQYGPGFSWTKIGRVTLTAGKHVIRFRLDGPRPEDKRFVASIDAVLISREPLSPHGPERPKIK